jgi:hypothetical protein
MAVLLAEMILTLDTITFETSITQFSLQVVTPYVILHAGFKTQDDRDAWVATVRAQAKTSEHAHMPEAIVQAARMRAKLDTFYDVTFQQRTNIGIALKKHGEWAIVKAADSSSAVTVGSSLVAINGISTTLDTYAQSMKQLQVRLMLMRCIHWRDAHKQTKHHSHKLRITFPVPGLEATSHIALS